MSKSFLDYLNQKEIKSKKIQLKKEDKKIEEIVEKPENVQLNEQVVKIEKKIQKDPLEHAMLIYEGLGKMSKGRGTIISDDINDPLAHAAMLL